MLLPGVGAQGATPADVARAFTAGPASALVDGVSLGDLRVSRHRRPTGARQRRPRRSSSPARCGLQQAGSADASTVSATADASESLLAVGRSRRRRSRRPCRLRAPTLCQPSIAAASCVPRRRRRRRPGARRATALARAIASITKLMTAIVVLEHARSSTTSCRVSPLRPRRSASRPSTSARRTGADRRTRCSARRSSRARTTPPTRSLFTSAADLPIASCDLMNAKARSSASATRTSRTRTASTQRGHVSSARDVTALAPLCARSPVHPRRAPRSSVTLPAAARSRRPTTCSELGAARRRQDRPHAGRGLVGDGRGASARRITVYGAVLGSDTRELAERRAAGAPVLRPRPVPPCPVDRQARACTRTVEHRVRTAGGRARRAAHARANRARRARRSSSASSRHPALALPVAKGAHSGRVEVYDGNRLVAVVEPRRRRSRRGCQASVGEARSGTRRRRRATSGRWSRDRHRHARTPRSTAR